MIIEELDDLLAALRLYAETMPIEARREFFADLEHLGGRPAISSRSFERMAEELTDFVEELEAEAAE